MPPVPFRAEPLAVLRARYPKALETLFNIDQISAGTSPRPGQFPANCFDHEDGLRLLVSRDEEPGGVQVIHVSASFETDSDTGRWFMDELKKPGSNILTVYDQWLDTIRLRFQELSGDDRPLEYLGTVEYVPHWRLQL